MSDHIHAIENAVRQQFTDGINSAADAILIDYLEMFEMFDGANDKSVPINALLEHQTEILQKDFANRAALKKDHQDIPSSLVDLRQLVSDKDKAVRQQAKLRVSELSPDAYDSAFEMFNIILKIAFVKGVSNFATGL